MPQSIHTLSMIFWKWTSTEQLWMSICWSELWISTESFLDLIFCARYPNTKSIESMTLDFPLPFGPIMHEKRCMIERKKLYSKGNRSWPVYITHFVCEQFKTKLFITLEAADCLIAWVLLPKVKQGSSPNKPPPSPPPRLSQLSEFHLVSSKQYCF